MLERYQSAIEPLRLDFAVANKTALDGVTAEEVSVGVDIPGMWLYGDCAKTVRMSIRIDNLKCNGQSTLLADIKI